MKRLLIAVLAGTMLFAAGCSDKTEETAPDAAVVRTTVEMMAIGDEPTPTATLSPEQAMLLARPSLCAVGVEDPEEYMVLAETAAPATDLPPEECPEEACPEEEAPEDEYADLALANVNNYVNVRSGPGTETSIVGKLYHGAVAHVLDVLGEGDNTWFNIISGNVSGYVKAEYFYYGPDVAERVEDYVTRYVVVLADRLNVREKPDVNSSRIGYVDHNEKAKIAEPGDEWVKIYYSGTKTGYVSAEYVTVEEEFIYAKTLEEEAAELAAERAAAAERERRARENEKKTSEKATISVQAPSSNYSTNSELRQAIVDYALQFEGNKYVHGGNSLVTGTDCSGFTSLIYKEFGYSLSRTPGGQLSGAGRSIEYSDIQPGDIICYGKSKCTHVALYIGDGKIIHAANSKKGVVIYTNAAYDNILGVRNVID